MIDDDQLQTSANEDVSNNVCRYLQTVDNDQCPRQLTMVANKHVSETISKVLQMVVNDQLQINMF